MVSTARHLLFVVDRDPHVRRLLRTFLGEAYELEFFDTGYTALDCVRRSPPSALVTEILVPELDGLALCRLLKSDHATSEVPILVFSILASAERAIDAGANAFLQKPLERERLLASLGSLTVTRTSGRPPEEQAPR